MALVDDIRELTDEVKALNRVTETYKLEIQKHDEQINGERGLSAAINALAASFAAAEKLARDNEKERRLDRRADRRLLWSIVAGIATMLIAAGIGIFFG